MSMRNDFFFLMLCLQLVDMSCAWAAVLTVVSVTASLTESRCSPNSYYKNCWMRRFPGVLINLKESERRGAQLLDRYAEESALKCSRTCCLTRNCKWPAWCQRQSDRLHAVHAVVTFIFQFLATWLFFTTKRLQTPPTASTCTVLHWRAASSAAERAQFFTTSGKVTLYIHTHTYTRIHIYVCV